MSDQSKDSKPFSQMLPESAPSSRQVSKFLTAVAIGATLLTLSGLTLTGTVIALVLATPALVLFSPILVPAGIVLFLVATGFMFSGGCVMAAITALTWIYNYVAGNQPPGAEKLDYARVRIADKGRDVKERTREFGQQKGHEVLQG